MKLITSIALLLITLNCFSQTLSEDDLYVTFLKAEKKSIVANNMNLTNEDAAIFWKIYDEYLIDRGLLLKDKGAVANFYLDNLENPSPEIIDKTITDNTKTRLKEAKLMKKYYKIMKKELNEEIGIRFYMIEEQLQLLLKVTMFEGIPLIDAYKK